MSYKKVFAQRIKGNNYKIHLWDDSGYKQIEWVNEAYIECPKQEATHRGFNGEYLKKTSYWYKDTPNLHFHDIPAHQKFLIEKYGINDEISQTHREIFFDIEIEMGEELTVEYIKRAPKPITSIAWYDKQVKQWGIVIIDSQNQIKPYSTNSVEVISCRTEKELLMKFLEKWQEMEPDIIISWNGDFFDIPYLYYRLCRVFDEDTAKSLSPIKEVRETPWLNNRGQYLQIAGVENLDYLRLHKKYNWKDEESWGLNYFGEKYLNLGKIEYEGNLDKLFQEDIEKFIKYNFRDVEILVKGDEKFEYIELTKNLSHKGKHNYSEIYANTKTQDGAISAYLLSKDIIPPSKGQFDYDETKKITYAGGYLFCPKAGKYNYLFDEDLTSLYPSIIRTLNIGRETYVGRIIDSDSRNNRLGLNDLKEKDPNEELLIENPKKKRTRIKVEELVKFIEKEKWTISANGTFFSTKRKSVMALLIKKWMEERVYYKEEMKKAYKQGNKKLGASFHLKQYTQKILLNSLYGALAVPGFRWGNIIFASATTLTGQRIIQESALLVNTHMNKVLRKEIKFFV